MLNNTSSRTRNTLKTMTILPLLAFLLWSFNVNAITSIKETENTNKVVTQSEKKTALIDKFRVNINKNTTDEQFEKIKADLKDQYKIDFNYKVSRNDVDEIISLSIRYNGNGNSGNYKVSGKKSIDELIFFIDDEGEPGVWSEASEKRQKEKLKKDQEMMDDDFDEDMEDDDSINNDNPIYFINGEESSKEDMKLLAPEKINEINVLKGEKAIKKYGDKGANGVVEITTKKG